jgi:hypothetical protein
MKKGSSSRSLYCSKVRFHRQCKNYFKDTLLVDHTVILPTNLLPSILERNPLLLFEQRNISDEGFLLPLLDKNKQHRTDKNGKLLYKTPFKNAFYKGLEFKIFETGRIKISGSLHKYFNSGAHNYNDFNFIDFCGVLDDLKDKFGIEPDKSVLKCLEIGVNIIPPIPTNDFLNYCFLHKTKPFEDLKNSDEGKYKQAQHSQYIIKIYNKALHYSRRGFPITNEILRFEIKYTKMEKLNKLGIFTLKDLVNYGLHNFKKELLIEFNNILFYDNTITSRRRNIYNYKNPLYWIDLLGNETNELFNYHRKQLKTITEHSSENIQLQTAEIISNKIDFLNANTTQIDPLTIMSKRVVLNNEITSKNTLCQVTVIKISMQKHDSILLSHTGLKYYFKNDKKVFEQIKRRFLSKQWSGADFKTQIKEIAHNIRNNKSNQKIKQNRIYKNGQLNFLNSFQL